MEKGVVEFQELKINHGLAGDVCIIGQWLFSGSLPADRLLPADTRKHDAQHGGGVPCPPWWC